MNVKWTLLCIDNGESFRKENENPLQEVGKAVERRKKDGFSLDQGRDKSGQREEKLQRGQTEEWGELRPVAGLTKTN